MLRPFHNICPKSLPVIYQCKQKLGLIKNFFFELTDKYHVITSVYFSHNPNKADVCIGDLELIYWEPTIKEKLQGLSFNISPTSFFQTNSNI